MKLHSLSLDFFRQHSNTIVSFPDGLTGIIGSNGAGKTSLIEAVVFALYGSKAVRGKVDDLKTRGTRRDSELSVELVFEHESNIFRLCRTLDDAELYIGGEAQPISSGNREVTSRVTAILRMQYEEFVATFFTEQKGLEFLSGKKGVTEREKFIVRMMGYDRLERAQELLRGDRRDKRNTAAGLEAGLGERSVIEERISSEAAELVSMEEKHSEAERVLTRAEKEVNSSKQILSNLEGRREEFNSYRQIINEKQVRYEEKAARAKILEGERQRLLSGQEGIENWIGQVDLQYLAAPPDPQSKIEDVTALLREAYLGAAARINQEEESLRSLTDDWRTALFAKKGEIDLLASQIAGLNKRAEDLAELRSGGECPTCGQELGDSFASVKDHFAGEIAEKQESLDNLRQAYTSLASEPAAITAVKESLKLAQDRRARIETDLQRLQAIQGKVSDLERFDRELAQIRSELAELNAALGEKRKLMADLRFSEEEHAKLKNHYDSTARLMEVARLQRVKLEGELNTKKAMLTRSKKELSDYDEKLAILNASKKDLILYEDSDRVLTEFRRYLNAQLRPRLAELASEFLSELTDGRYTAVDIAADFTPTVLEDGLPKPVISGGEEDLLNLCVRLALSNMLAERSGHSFSLLVLDEVFGSLDEGRRSNVLNLLDKLGNRFEQILVITHLEDIREGVQNLMYVNYDETSGELRIEDPLKFEESAMVFNL